MIVEIASIIGAAIVALFIGGSIGARTRVPGWVAFSVVTGLLAAALYPTVISIYGTAALIATPPTLILVHNARSLYKKRRALNGSYGQETQWAAEIIEEGEDEHFVLALTGLPENELMEVGVIADSKEEMRELVKERFEKQNTDTDTDPIEEML